MTQDRTDPEDGIPGRDLGDESFANAPQSITELRSDREGNGALWTPRDALVFMLREIDAGRLIIVNMVVAYETETGFGNYTNACRNKAVALGVLEGAKYAICEQT